MRLFVDTSVLLAAADSATGASRSIFGLCQANHWKLLTAEYCLEELRNNIHRFRPSAAVVFEKTLRPQLKAVETKYSLDRPLVFTKAKDRPVLLSALGARADYLITLDVADFQKALGAQIYGMQIRRPGPFISEQRCSGKLREE